MAMLGIKYDRSVWKKTLVARIQEDGRRQWRNGFGINEREQQYIHTGLKITGFASQFASQNQPVENQINI